MRRLIDTGAVLALMDSHDQHHLAAAAFAYKHANNDWILPETVFVETMVLIKARINAQRAINVGQSLMKSERFTIVPLDEKYRQETWNIFVRYSDKQWSYVDCSILALARQMQIKHVFAFDHHFNQMAELQREP